MDVVSRVSDCKKYLHICVDSELSYRNALQLAEIAHQLASTQGVRNFFFDLRGIRNTATTSQNYKLISEDIERIGFDKTAKVALLIDEFDESHDFIGSAANSAGYNLKSFTCESTLLEWIQI